MPRPLVVDGNLVRRSSPPCRGPLRLSTLSSRTPKARRWWPQVHRSVGASLWVEPAARGSFQGRGGEGKRWAGHINPHVAMARLVWRWSSFRRPPTLPALQRAVPNSFEILSLLFPRLPFFVFQQLHSPHWAAVTQNVGSGSREVPWPQASPVGTIIISLPGSVLAPWQHPNNT